VQRYVDPEEFRAYRDAALAKGFLEAVAGPFVRSSYRAERVLEHDNVGLDRESVLDGIRDSSATMSPMRC
jgi:lipoic acid synthetase